MKSPMSNLSYIIMLSLTLAHARPQQPFPSLFFPTPSKNDTLAYEAEQAAMNNRSSPSYICVCHITTDRVQVLYWPSLPSNITSRNASIATTLISDNFTFTSPSIYVAYTNLYADSINGCSGFDRQGQNLGHRYKDVTIGYPPGSLQTAVCDGDLLGLPGWKALNPHDLEVPTQNWVIEGSSSCIYGRRQTEGPNGTDLWRSPTISVPDSLSAYDPAWSYCTGWQWGGIDPPRALTSVAALGPITTPSRTTSDSTAVPHPYITASYPDSTPAAALPKSEVSPTKTSGQAMPAISSQTAKLIPPAGEGFDKPKLPPQSNIPAASSQPPPGDPASSLKASDSFRPANSNSNSPSPNPAPNQPKTGLSSESAESQDHTYAVENSGPSLPRQSPTRDQNIPGMVASAISAALYLGQANEQHNPDLLADSAAADLPHSYGVMSTLLFSGDSKPSQEEPTPSSHNAGDVSIIDTASPPLSQVKPINQPLSTETPGLPPGQSAKITLPKIGDLPLQLAPNGNLVVGSSTLLAGIQATMSGVSISPDSSEVVIDSSTYYISTPAVSGSPSISNPKIQAPASATSSVPTDGVKKAEPAGDDNLSVILSILWSHTTAVSTPQIIVAAASETMILDATKAVIGTTTLSLTDAAATISGTVFSLGLQGLRVDPSVLSSVVTVAGQDVSSVSAEEGIDSSMSPGLGSSQAPNSTVEGASKTGLVNEMSTTISAKSPTLSAELPTGITGAQRPTVSKSRGSVLTPLIWLLAILLIISIRSQTR